MVSTGAKVAAVGALAAGAGAGVVAYLALKGPPRVLALDVNGSIAPLPVPSGTLVTVTATGGTPNGAVDVYYSTGPSIATALTTTPARSDADGSLTATVRVVGPESGERFYLGAKDLASGAVSNWVALGVTPPPNNGGGGGGGDSSGVLTVKVVSSPSLSAATVSVTGGTPSGKASVAFTTPVSATPQNSNDTFNASGAFTLVLPQPKAGNYSVVVTDITTGDEASASWTVA